LGSVYSSLYGNHLVARSLPGVPTTVLHSARSSFGAGQAAVAHLSGASQAALGHAITSGFLAGLDAACLVASGVCLVGALAVAALLPSRPGHPDLVVPAGQPVLGGRAETRDQVANLSR
ncbi:MAG: hypothetical protein M3137_09505, partial [Actinomycetota bacterium]|nr:hypothetical protein [Actinomycetota bacterium]